MDLYDREIIRAADGTLRSNIIVPLRGQSRTQRAAAPVPQNETIDEELLAEARRLHEENKRLRAEARSTKLAENYINRVRELRSTLVSGHAAVTQAARELPKGQAIWLERSNRELGKAVGPSLKSRATQQPIHGDTSDLCQARAEAFNEVVSGILAIEPTLDRRSAIRQAARARPRLYAAWTARNTAAFNDTSAR